MNLLPTWLWKEWRDHRSVVVATALALPLLTLLFEFALPSFADHPAVPFIAALVAFTIVVLALYGDVFAGEERRGTIAFLRRQPGGWWPPFAAKFLFLALVTVLVCGEAFGFAKLATWVVHGAAQAAIDARRGAEWKDFVEGFATVLLLLVVPGWTIVVSIWFPRSVVALPGAAVVLVLFAAPVALTVAFNDGLWPTVAEAFVVLGLSVAAVPLVAAISFARGRAIERGPRHAGVVGLVATFALFTPAYAWTTKRAHDFRSVDPLAATFRIGEPNCISTNGRFAYVTAFHASDPASSSRGGRTTGDGPDHALCIDLGDGTWRELADSGARVSRAPGGLMKASAPNVIVQDVSARKRPSRHVTIPGVSPDCPELPVFDAESGALERFDLDLAFMGARDDAGARFQKLANYVLLPDGSRAWFDHGHLVRSTALGGTRVLPDSELANGDGWIGDESSYGHGAWLGSNTCYDAIRERRFTLPQGTLVRWIHDGSCIVLDAKPKQPLGSFWQMWDIETQKLTPIPGLLQGEAALQMVDDGRLIVGPWPVRREMGWQVALLDPKSGAREPIPLPASAADAMPGLSIQTRTPAGVPVMSLHSEKEQRWRFARFDLAARRFDLLATGVDEPLSLVGCADEESAVMTDGRRLLRAWFTKPGVEVLFPKPVQ